MLTCRASSSSHSIDIRLLLARHCSQLWGPSREQSSLQGARRPRAAFPSVRGCSHRRSTVAVTALVSHRSTSPTGRPHPCPGAPLRLLLTPFSARRGDWLLSFVYRTSSVQLHVAGLQPVLLQDRRMENVDLSSVVSTACPSQALGFQWGDSLTPALQAPPMDISPAHFTPEEGGHRTCLGRGNSSLRGHP